MENETGNEHRNVNDDKVSVTMSSSSSSSPCPPSRSSSASTSCYLAADEIDCQLGARIRSTSPPPAKMHLKSYLYNHEEQQVDYDNKLLDDGGHKGDDDNDDNDDEDDNLMVDVDDSDLDLDHQQHIGTSDRGVRPAETLGTVRASRPQHLSFAIDKLLD